MIRVPEAPLGGQFVALRQWEPDDAEWYVAARDEEIFRWTTEPRELDPDVLRRVIEANRQEPRWVGLAITDGSSGERLGNIALTITDPEHRVGEGHYWLAAGARGRRAASDAVRTIAQWAFASLPIDRIDLLINPGNVASKRVARRTGFEDVGERDGRRVFALTNTFASRR